MKIDIIITDKGEESTSALTSELIRNVRFHINDSVHTCYNPLFRDNGMNGTQGFDVVINVNDNSSARMKDIKKLVKIITDDASKNKGQTKFITLSFRRTNMPLAEQNEFIKSIATFAHDLFRGNPDYVNSALLINYETCENIDADFGEVPNCTIVFGIEDCVKPYAALCKKVMSELINSLSEIK